MASFTWRLERAAVAVTVDDAEWWGASLGVLVSAIHHPRLLAAQQPGTDPVAVAREVIDNLGQLHAAAAASAHDLSGDEEDEAGPAGAGVRRDGDDIVFTPGAEIADLAWCLEVFAKAVLDPRGREANVARGASTYAASAWSGDIGKVSGALQR